MLDDESSGPAVDLQVEAAERYERAWARRAAASLCVSAAMQRELQHGW